MGDIVVGYDGGEAATRALDRAIEEAQTRHARLVVLAVLEMPLNPQGLQTFGTLGDSRSPGMPVVEPPEIGEVFASARERIAASGLTADYAWAAGEPGAAIVGEARERGAELVVVGAHHHGFLSRLLGTDVPAEVERSAGCDVIVVE